MGERIAGTYETDSAEGAKHGTEADEAGALGGVQGAPFNMRKRIGSTTYEVEVHFSHASRETLDEKILRLAMNEGAVEAKK